MKDINIVGIEDNITHSVAPLHWIAVDKLRNCITIEITKDGIEIFNNPLKILANSPNFQWHMTNLRNYMNLSTSQIQETTWDNISLIPFGQGTGTFGLPGDYTSASRFVRTAFLKSCISPISQNLDAINMCFNIMKSVTIPRGVVMTNRGTYDYTQYTVFFNLFTGDYYFNTQNNNNILTVNLNDISINTISSLGKLNQVTTFEKLKK
ncbi:Penicillin acylase precursor [compost metagenome]